MRWRTGEGDAPRRSHLNNVILVSSVHAVDTLHCCLPKSSGRFSDYAIAFFIPTLFVHPQVADYGLARTTEVMLGAHDRTAQSGGSSSTGSRKRSRSHRAGTLRWTAPELLQPAAESGDPFSEASDVYRCDCVKEQ